MTSANGNRNAHAAVARAGRGPRGAGARVAARSRIARGCMAALAAAALLAASGCSLLGGSKEPPTYFAPQPAVQADPSWPQVGWQLTLAAVQVARPVDSTRIAVRPTPQELQVYKDAGWAQPPGDMLERSLLRLFEDSGKIPAVARAGAGVNADYRLVLDVRRFESDYAGGASPSAVIEVNAKLLHALDREVVASRTFLQATPAAGTAVPEVVAAFERGLGAVTRDIAGWTLTAGHDHDRSPHD